MTLSPLRIRATLGIEGPHSGRYEACPLDQWPVGPPSNWIADVNAAESGEELEALRTNVHRDAPYGQANWRERMASRLGLESSLRPRGCPRTPK